MYLYVVLSNNLILIFFIHCNKEDAILQSNQRQIVIRKQDHAFSMYSKFSDKLTFLTPWNAHIRVRIKG